MDIGVFQKDKKKLTDIGFFGWFFSGLLDQNCFSRIGMIDITINQLLM